jgi:hypothetical protein
MQNRIIFISLLAVLSLTACNDQLDEINVNPNAAESPNPTYLLTGVLKQGADAYWGINSNFGSTLLFVQHWAKIQYPAVDRYVLTNTAGEVSSLWDTGYATLIADLNTILDLPDEQANAGYKGVALVLRSWVFLLLTDLYGDIPYREAGKSVTPAYDTQRDVYTGLLAELSEALNLLSNSKGQITGDLVYKGDLSLWQKFANSLRLRIALRIADREDALAKQTVTEATSHPAGLIAANSEAFRFIYTKSPQHNPQAATFDTRDDYRISHTIVERLKELSDPRLPVYAQLPSDPAIAGEYVGGRNGLSNDDASNQGLARTSKPGAYFLTPEAPAMIYSYAEVLFNLAEATARGYISGNAETYYQEAITASLQQFGITEPAVINAYLSQAAVAYSGNYRQSIGEQKWLAFFGQGLDAFAEWRRLDYPQLTPGPSTVLEGKMPLRFFYPGSEQSLNGDSYHAAVAHQGDDLLTTPLWFDVK